MKDRLFRAFRMEWCWNAEAFWKQLRIYFNQDIFPDPQNEDREYFLSDTEYRVHIQNIHDRPVNRCYYLFFHRDGRDIGFEMPVIYTSGLSKTALVRGENR